MNSWRARGLMLAIIVGVMIAHKVLTESVENTPTGMLLYHGSAMLCDWLLLWLVAPKLLQGRLLDWSQWFLVAFMTVNLAGWLLYMSYAPPSIYDTYMWVLTVAEWVCFFIPDRTDEDNSTDRPRVDMVRHRYFGGSRNYTRTEK